MVNLERQTAVLLGIPSIFGFPTGLGVQVLTLQAANEQHVREFVALHQILLRRSL